MKKNKQSDLLLIPKQASGTFSLKEQYVSFEKDTSKLKKQIGLLDYNRFIKLYDTNRKGLKLAIRDLIDLKTTYPKCAEIYNLLSFFYIRRRRVKKAEAVILENYTKNPDDLLAKINYADQLLRKKKFKSIDAVFQGQSDLRDIYPDQTVFPLSEFRGFMVLMGLYKLSQKNTHEAECFHYIAARVDKDHSQVKFLRRKLFRKPRYKRIYEKINSKLRRHK